MASPALELDGNLRPLLVQRDEAMQRFGYLALNSSQRARSARQVGLGDGRIVIGAPSSR